MIQDDDIFREVILKSWNLFDENEQKQEHQEKEQKEQNVELIYNNIFIIIIFINNMYYYK